MQKADNNVGTLLGKTASDTRRPRVLLVDDEEILLEFYEAVLSSEYEVFVAGDIGTAQLLIEEHRVDALACDFHFSGGSGLDLLSWIDLKHPGLLRNTMILSGDPNPELGKFKVRVVCKPVTADDLANSLALLLNQTTGEGS